MTAAPAPTIRLIAGVCPDCDAPIVWTLRAGKRVAFDAKPIEVVPYDGNLIDVALWKSDVERVLLDTGETISGWRVAPEVRPDLPRVSGRTGHWGNCCPDDPLGREHKARRMERRDVARDRAGLGRGTA